MKHKNITVWGFSFAGVLGVTAGLRDLFAPGFISMSPRFPSTGDIIGQFVVALTFFAVAAFSGSQNLDRVNKK